MFGPFHENQRAMADALLAADAGAVVRDTGEFSLAAALWLENDTARRAAGGRARDAVERMAGGVETTLKHLRTLIRVA
jgi:3-deoxy-D-manno-octulosonic-acid transferase